jgi:transposase
MNMQDALVPDELWELVEPLLPPPRPKKKLGRPLVPDRACLAGIVYLLKTGCQWKYLPVKELSCGSPATVWRRFDAWSKADVWARLHRKILDWCAAIGEVDARHVIIDAASMRAFFGGRTLGPIPLTGPKMAVKDRSSPTPVVFR